MKKIQFLVLCLHLAQSMAYTKLHSYPKNIANKLLASWTSLNSVFKKCFNIQSLIAKPDEHTDIY